MTMGIAPATVLGADEAGPAAGDSPAQVQGHAVPRAKAGGAYLKFDDVKGESRAGAPAVQKKFEKVQLPDRSDHQSEQGEAVGDAAQKSGQGSGAGGPK